jgi:hypothetical protein
MTISPTPVFLASNGTTVATGTISVTPVGRIGSREQKVHPTGATGVNTCEQLKIKAHTRSGRSMEFNEVKRADTYSVHRHPETGLFLFRWEEFVTGEPFRGAARDWEEYLAEHSETRYMVDTRTVSAHDDADKQWLAETWIPDLIEMGVRRGAGIYGESAISEMDMGRIEESLSLIDPGYEFRVFETTDEAAEWIRQQDVPTSAANS